MIAKTPRGLTQMTAPGYLKNIMHCTQKEYSKLASNGEIDDNVSYIIKDDSCSYATTTNSYINDNIIAGPYLAAAATDISSKIGLDYDDIFKEMAKRFNRTPTVEHKCHNCGGTLEIKPDQGIFKCPYCHSVYAIGTTKINDKA